MKRWAGLGIGVAVLAISAAEPEPTLLRNGSFEDLETERENPYNDLAAHWGRWGNWMNREVYWQPTRSGVGMMGYHHWRIEEDTTSGFYQDIPGVPAGSEATFSIYVYKDPDTNAEHVELRLEPENGGTALAAEFFPLRELKTATWQKVSVTGPAPTGGLRVLVICKPRQGGERQGAIKFDDATLTVAQPPPAD